MNKKLGRVLAVCLNVLVLGLSSASVFAESRADVIHVPAFDLPISGFLSAETRAALQWRARQQQACRLDITTSQSILAGRRCWDEHYYPALIARHRARYEVRIQPETIAGVATEIITPEEGVTAANRQRVLINLHGGAFMIGGRWGGQIESIPIAALGKYRVVSVDYRMAPEHEFPAASEDAAAVYRELLKTYRPEDIGIYGCSAGGLLTAQVVAWLQRAELPPPGAVGMFCAAGSYYGEGDSGPFVASLIGFPIDRLIDAHADPYLKNSFASDPLVFPTRSREVLSKFPPSLLISSTRDQALSSVVYMHSRLVALGVDADLHIWEGLEHAFFMNPDLPESREVYDVAVKFFDRHLGKSVQATPATRSSAALDELMRSQIEGFVEADRASFPAACQLLFVGSSSIAVWRTVQEDMAPLPVINRGFGGSHVEHVNLWFDKVVAPYRPRAIVFYAGENDIAAGKSVKRVVADFDTFMARKTVALGSTPVYFISLKPSKLRFWQFSLQKEVNEAIRARAAQRLDLHYIDVVPSMLSASKPKDVFVADGLHMNPQGYAIWTQAVRNALMPQTEAEAQHCLQTQGGGSK